MQLLMAVSRINGGEGDSFSPFFSLFFPIHPAICSLSLAHPTIARNKDAISSDKRTTQLSKENGDRIDVKPFRIPSPSHSDTYNISFSFLIIHVPLGHFRESFCFFAYIS